MRPIHLLPLLLLTACPKPDESGDTDIQDGDPIENEWGFDMFAPTSAEVDCDGTAQVFEDMDWLCTFEVDGTSAMVYAASRATSCLVTMSYVPLFETQAWMWRNGAVTALEGALYDWGGNHHNDQLEFQWEGQRYLYSHSSFGFGWRSCQEMDCLQVTGTDGALVQDGCGCDRTLPIVCRQVMADGTWGDFTDTFARCNGDECAE